MTKSVWWIERVILPFFLISSCISTLHSLVSNSFDFLIFFRGVFVPLFVVGLLLAARTASIARADPWSIIGTLLSFAGAYVFQSSPNLLPSWLSFIGLITVVFYLSLLVWSYKVLGRNVGLMPALRTIVISGPFEIVRHPIYSSYMHLSLAYVLLIPIYQNMFAASLVCIGLYMRMSREEALLVSDPIYLKYLSNVPNRVSAFAISFPVFILMFATAYFRFDSPKSRTGIESVSVQLAFPVTSLSPLIYDDWSSVFIGNHIYRRLLPEPERNIVSAVAKDFKILCDDRSASQEKCRQVRVTFNINTFVDCAGFEYSKLDVKKEFLTILKAKEWIFPNFRICEDGVSDICIVGTNEPELIRNFRNLYFRFGWSKSRGERNVIGSGPYCLQVGVSERGTITSGRLVIREEFNRLPLPSEISFYTSTNPQDNFDVALYGTSGLVDQNRINVPTQTPLGYFVVSNPKLEGRSLPWNEIGAREIIKGFLRESSIIYGAPGALDKLMPQGSTATVLKSASFETIPSDFSALMIPDYFPNCDVLRNKLNQYWHAQRIDARAVCGNTSALAERISKYGEIKWGAFLTPLSPGAPGRNSLRYQYFSSTTSESWLRGSTNPNTLFYLVGIGQSFATLDRRRICALAPNPLGLGDVFVSDFVACGQ